MTDKQKAIVHVDGDAFFASCEIAQNEAWRGKPVVVGADKGIALAVSYAAKKLGIGRGTLIHEIKKSHPETIITDVHYELYKTYARRMYAIVRRFTPIVEEYSIDECFADISHLDQSLWEQTARKIQKSLSVDLGLSFSLGLAPTKVLAKVASKIKKPAGFSVITKETAHAFLENVPIGRIWGVGPSASASLVSQGVKTALDFALKPEWWILERMAKPHQHMWYELNGISTHQVHPEPTDIQKSVMKTRTFRPTKDRGYVLSELSKNTENACRKLRKNGLVGKEFSYYLKTQTFFYHRASCSLFRRSANPQDYTREIMKHFHELWRPKTEYRATGIVIYNIGIAEGEQEDLFGLSESLGEINNISKTVDNLNKKYADQKVFFAGSLRARQRQHDPRTRFERLSIPYWGEAT